ncbi:MAG TPA: hypothetical protein VFG10_15815 [Saprospiraceae bacterium]|nr:hypothetical protein [Saprospiraceae bacterium]
MKLSLALNFILVIVVAFLSYRLLRPNMPTSINPKPFSNCRVMETDDFVGAPPNIISFRTAKFLSEKYASDTGKSLINSETGMNFGKNDAISCWFPMDDIKQFIWFTESQMCRFSCSDTVQLGIRFYYGIYPDNVHTQKDYPDLNGLPQSFSNRHTLFMIPMYKNQRGKWIEFDPSAIQKNCDLPRGIDTSNIKPFILSLRNANGDGHDDANNHGGLRPPPYDSLNYTFPQQPR